MGTADIGKEDISHAQNPNAMKHATDHLYISGAEAEEQKEKDLQQSGSQNEMIKGQGEEKVKPVLFSWTESTKGTIYCFFGACVLTIDTLMLRLVEEVETETVCFWKFLFYAVSLAFVIFLNGKLSLTNFYNSFIGIGKVGLFAGIVWGVSNVLFVQAINSSAAGTVLIILASNPLFVVVLSRLFLKSDVVPLRTWLCVIVCLAALILIFAGNLTEKTESVVGLILAFFATLTTSIYFVLLRFASKFNDGKEPDLLPCNVIAGIVCSCISACYGTNLTAGISSTSWGMLLLQGLVTFPLAFGLLTMGSERVPASEVALYCLIETVLGPVWVFVGGYERPPIFTIYGGIIIIVALFANSYLGLREELQQSATATLGESNDNVAPTKHDQNLIADCEAGNDSKGDIFDEGLDGSGDGTNQARKNGGYLEIETMAVDVQET